MTIVRTIRCVRAGLMALFVVAQVAGVVPLICDHTLNVYEVTPVAAHRHLPVSSTLASPDADHHHGLLGLHDQCCALHTLAGPLPDVFDTASDHLASVRIVPDELVAVFGAYPGVIDRPPRPVPLS